MSRANVRESKVDKVKDANVEKWLIVTLARDVQTATKLIITAVDDENISLALKAIDNAQHELDAIRRLLHLNPPKSAP